MKDAVKVLVVEDEPIIALDLEHKLKGFGYALAGLASSGEAAVATAVDRRPDLVLMDIHLQGAMDDSAAKSASSSPSMRRRWTCGNGRPGPTA